MAKKFKTPLDVLCGKGKIVDQTHYIYFKDEFIYVTNGNTSIKQHMSLHGLSEKEMKLLHMCRMPKDVFKLINKYENLEFQCLNECQSTGIKFEIAGSSFYCRLHKLRKNSASMKLVEQIDRSFSRFNMKEVKEVAINPDYITLLRKVMVTESSGFTFRFNEVTGGVLVTPNKNNVKEHAMIIPLIVTGELC